MTYKQPRNHAFFLIPVFLIMLSACSPSGKTVIEGEITMTMEIGGVRTLFPSIILSTDDTSYFLWLHEGSIITQDDRSASILTPFVLSVDHIYRAKGEIIAAGDKPTDPSPMPFPESLPEDYNGLPIKILKISTLEKRGAKKE